jgi:hypothetical protein
MELTDPKTVLDGSACRVLGSGSSLAHNKHTQSDIQRTPAKSVREDRLSWKMH